MKKEKQMAKGRPKGSKNKTADEQPKNDAPDSTRVTVHGPNGQSSMAVAPAPAAPTIVIPEQEVAQKVLAELADLNAKAEAARRDWDDKHERAKKAKGVWDDAVAAVLTRLKAATSPAPLPLFDAKQREADQQKMEQAAKTGPLNEEPKQEASPAVTVDDPAPSVPVPAGDFVF